jgi:zinc protease
MRRSGRLTAGLLLATSALVPVTPPPAEAAPSTVPEAMVMANGLTVFVKAIKGATSVALVVVFKVGGDHDPAGKSGLAHLIEHCYVTASAGTCPSRTSEDILRRYAQGHTAQTADRHTIVAQMFPVERLDEELHDAADRMGALNVTAEDLAREKPRVLLEVGNMFEKKPDLAALNRAREIVLPNRAGGRRGGLPAHVEALTLADVRGFVEQHYKPGNAVLALAGAVEVDSVRVRVRALFGDIAKGSPPSLTPAPPEPTSASARLDDVTIPMSILGGESTACIAFAAPPPTSPDYMPFLVVAARLIKAPAARTANSPTAIFSPLDDPGVLYVRAPLAEDQKTEAAVKALHAWVAEAVGRPGRPSDVPLTAGLFGLVLGIDTSQEFSLVRYPYPMALRLAAGNVLGVDASAITKSLERMRGPEIAESAVRLFDPLKSGAAVVRVKP